MTRARRGLWITAILFAIGGAILIERLIGVTPYVRHEVVATLNARFASHVELDSLHVSMFPRPAIYGEGLTLRYNGRQDVPPLIEVPSFSASAGLWGVSGKPVHLKTVTLDGLTVKIPVGGLNPGKAKPPSAAAGFTAPPRTAAPLGKASGTVLIDHLVSRQATLEIASKDPTKLPRLFEIHNLEMLGLGEGDGATFRAALTNPKPQGRIDTNGTFGPWNTDNARQTPLRGDYVLAKANLDTIKGISGILSSTGRYRGVLERIDVNGRTETPDFSIDVSGQAVPLSTTYVAVVDGTNGNTWLERVEAKLRNTTIIARGAVVRAREVKGREIALDVTIDDGRLEDILALVIKSTKPPVTGGMTLKTRLVIPAGDKSVVDKLQLAGAFELAQARFTNLNVQGRVDMLSRRGQGDTGEGDEGESVVSNLRGRFAMRDGAIQFSELAFAIPGAIVLLAGGYHLRSEVIDFTGHLLLDATLSQMTTGWKSVAARFAQPLFRRPGGGAKLPIRISGTRSKPAFGLDAKRAFSRG